jgi:uncharacterized protein YqgC (DUF456 family)
VEAFADWLFVVLWLLGVILTFVPFVPATLVILLAAFLHELLVGFRELSLGAWLLLGVLALLAMVLDNLAALLGARRYGAGRRGSGGLFWGGFWAFSWASLGSSFSPSSWPGSLSTSRGGSPRRP